VPWWGWLAVGLAVVAALGALAVAYRSQLRFAVKFARTLMSDRRVPRPLRWLIGVSLAMKVVPFPDFGIDEVVLTIVGLILIVFYRPVLRAILEETRLARVDEAGSQRTATPKGEDPASP
jgi:hypothetical protein